MSEILQKLCDVDPNDSEAVKNIITSFFQKLPKHTEVNCNIWLRILEEIITRFPRYCSQHRSTAEKYIAYFLASTTYFDVVLAAKCAHGLQQIRPSQDKTATPKNCWREQMAILCNTAHMLIDAIFNKTVNNYKDNNNFTKQDGVLSKTPLTVALSQALNLKKVQGVDKKTVLCNKLKNVFIFIQSMLVEVYPVGKPIQPQLILEVTVQALTVSSNVECGVSESAMIKTEALRTIDAMIACLESNLIPFSGLVIRSVMQTLRWSSAQSGDESNDKSDDKTRKEYSKVRISAYKTLNKWLNTLHVHKVSSDHQGKAWEDEITKIITDDITPNVKIVQLMMNSGPTKNLSKKARKRLANQMLQQSSISNHIPGEKNKAVAFEEASDDVAIAALECAETFLTVCGIFLKTTTHKVFQERLVREAYKTDHNSERSLHILRALEASRKNTPSSVPPPTQYCLALYSALVNSRAEEIRKFCSQALLDIRLHLHCSPPSISFSIDKLEAKKTDSKRKMISEENSAKLALLADTPEPGSPLVNGQDDVDAASSPKRARIEESDKIVIDSDSDDDVQEVTTNDSDDDVQAIDKPTNDNNVEEDSQETDVEKAQVEEQPVIESDASMETTDIHHAKTQLQLNISNDSADDTKSTESMEIAYDNDPNKITKTQVLEIIDGENLPSTNETDDIQITCGQALNSQDVPKTGEELLKDGEIGEIEVSRDTNVDEELEKKLLEDPVSQESDKEPVEHIKVQVTSQELTINDMLADFVDEVQDEPSTVSTQ